MSVNHFEFQPADIDIQSSSTRWQILGVTVPASHDLQYISTTFLGNSQNIKDALEASTDLKDSIHPYTYTQSMWPLSPFKVSFDGEWELLSRTVVDEATRL